MLHHLPAYLHMVVWADMAMGSGLLVLGGVWTHMFKHSSLHMIPRVRVGSIMGRAGC